MKAQDVKAGMTSTQFNERRRVEGGWKATGDAVVEAGMVYIPVHFYAGPESTITYIYDAEVEVDE